MTSLGTEEMHTGRLFIFTSILVRVHLCEYLQPVLTPGPNPPPQWVQYPKSRRASLPEPEITAEAGFETSPPCGAELAGRTEVDQHTTPLFSTTHLSLSILLHPSSALCVPQMLADVS